jgi:hypothetical protein
MYAVIEDNKVVAYGTVEQILNVSIGEAGIDKDFLKKNNLVEAITKIDYDSDVEKIVFTEPYIKDKKVYSVKKEKLSKEEIKANIEAHVDFELLSMEGRKDKAAKDYIKALQTIKTQAETFSKIDWPTKPMEDKTE